MKNLRIKILLLLISLLTITTVLTLIENAKTIDIVVTKNLSYRKSSLNKILEISELKLRKAEGAKFIKNLNENHINDQHKRTNIFALLSVAFIFSLICFVITLFETLKKRNNVG